MLFIFVVILTLLIVSDAHGIRLINEHICMYVHYAMFFSLAIPILLPWIIWRNKIHIYLNS